MKKQKTDSIRNRVFSFMSAIIFGLNSIPMMTYTTANAASSASSSGSVMFPKNDADKSAKLNHDDTLVDNGDGTFTYTSKISASYSYLDTSKGRLQTTDNYYEFKKKGKYLIELWGGDGGDGGRALFSGRNGIGGQGGFVYGILDVDDSMLNKRLYYEIGSKGESKTYDVAGGGSAGDGGGAGNIALVSIGAGGGYSAVYLLDKDEPITTDPQLAPDTIDPNSIRDNAEKVLMIAGGGGGGASGANGLHFTALVLKMHGDGGDGGSEQSSIIATPNIGNFTTGTYYAGDDGTSSGGKASYVGQGGTDKPEGLAKTAIGFMTASTYANDWQRTYHHELRRGVGGAGNLHGGGGGAGFAGGGGGIQNVILDANNVGGGGGGSSYLACNTDENNFYPLNTLSGYDDIESSDYFVDKGDNTNADIGGAIVIRYLEDNHYYDYLSNVTISSKVSDYFVIDTDKSSCYCSTDPNNDCLTVDADNNGISFSGSLEPQTKGITMGQPKNTLTLTLRLKPKTGFAGGNDVPIFDTTADGMAFTCAENKDGTNKTCYFLDTSDNKEKDVSYVNVPYNLNFTANSMTKGIGDTYTHDNLKNTPVSYESSNPMHDFITDIKYSVLDDSEQTFSDKTVAIEDVGKTYNYQVKATITPKNNLPAKVGDAGSTTITKTAKVRCVEESPLDIDGFYVTPKKSLIYNESDKTYDLDLDLKIKRKDETIFKNDIYYLKSKTQEATRAANNNNTSTSWGQTSGSYTIPADGWYYLQTWGGNGGTGGDFLRVGHDPGTGGTGGYVAGYAYLRKGQIINYKIGSYGGNGIDGRGSSRSGGYGGAYSELQIDNVPIMIAGGGAGGNAIYFGGIDSDDGADGASAGQNYSTEISSDKSVYNGSNGIHPEKKLNATNTDNVPQPAGKNYLNTSLVNAGNKELQNSFGDTVVLTAPSPSGFSDSKSVTGGRIAITRLATTEDMTKEKESLENRLSDFLVDEEYSQYFDVQDILINGTSINSTDTSNIALNIKDIVQYSETFTDDSGYSSGYYAKGDITDFISNGINKKITVKLKPKDLVGGNDIPLLDKVINEDTPDITAVKLSHSDTTTESDDVGYVEANPSTDYANVEIDEKAFDLKEFPQEVIVDYGEAATINTGIEYVSGKNHEFVDESVSVAPSELTKDGKYTVVGTVKPKDDAQNAVEIPSVEPKHKSGQVNVRIKYTVNKELTDLHQASVEYLDNGKTTVMENGGNVSLANDKDSFTVDDIHDAYVFTIEPDADYDLPADTAVTVTYGDGEAVMAADIKKKDGKMIITIPSSAFTNNITISARGIEDRTPHYVHFLYSVYDKIGGFQTYEEVVKDDNGEKKEFFSGEDISDVTKPTIPLPYPEGYDDYVWEWSVEPIGGKYFMGDKDVYIMGNYMPITYTLNIKYVAADESDTDFIAPPEYTSPRQSYFDEAKGVSDIAITKGAEFSIKSPEVDGYVPDKLYYSGTADDTFLSNFDANKQFTAYVRYTKDESPLKIYLIKCDDNGIPNDNGTLGTSADATWDGYDRFKITKWDDTTQKEVSYTTFTGSETEGTYYVYYKPHHEQIPISFNKVDPFVTDIPDSEKVTLPNNRMEYVYEGMEFSYFDTQNDKYVSLPKPVCSENWLFDGWYTADGQLITDDTTVKSGYVDSETNKIELYAHWLKDEFTISVDYRYARNATPDPGELIDVNAITSDPKINQDSKTLRYNMGYSFTSPVVDGYDLVKDEEAVIAGNAVKDEHFNVYYLNNNIDPANTFTLTVNVYSETYRDGSTDNPVSSARKLQGGTFALYQNGTKVDGSERYNENGTITWSNAETAITADVVYTVKCIDPPMGYGTASVNIRSNEGEKNIFLDRAPIILPMAGSKPMTGYTVFGISAMLLAGLLMFAYVSSRTEENNEKE